MEGATRRRLTQPIGATVTSLSETSGPVRSASAGAFESPEVPQSCPPGFDVWLRLTLPADLDCSPAALARLPLMVRLVVNSSGRWLLLPADHEQAGPALSVPGVRVERYFRSIHDPLRGCLYHRVGRECLHNPGCADHDERVQIVREVR